MEDGYLIKEFSVDGVNVLYTDKTLIVANIEPSPPVEEEKELTVEEMQAKILLNTELLLIQKELGL